MPFDCDALLADGSVVTIRPAAAADRDALRALHEGLSPESLYLRFFSVSRQAALEYVDRLLLPQTSDHATLVGVAGDRMLAVGNFERLDGSPEAEIALVVADPRARSRGGDPAHRGPCGARPGGRDPTVPRGDPRRERDDAARARRHRLPGGEAVRRRRGRRDRHARC